MITFLIIYLIGYILAYYLKRYDLKKYYRLYNISYNWDDILFNSFFSLFSWAAVLVNSIFIIDNLLVNYFNKKPIKIPKWL